MVDPVEATPSVIKSTSYNMVTSQQSDHGQIHHIIFQGTVFSKVVICEPELTGHPANPWREFRVNIPHILTHLLSFIQV